MPTPGQKPSPVPSFPPVSGPLVRGQGHLPAFARMPDAAAATADYLRLSHAQTPPQPMRVLGLSGDNSGPLAPLLNGAAQAIGLRTGNGDVRLAYEPRAFTGAKQLVEVMQPPGYASFPPDVEYMLKFGKVGIDNGELKGEAQQYWRGTKDHAETRDSAADIGHGLHDNTMNPQALTTIGASKGDRDSFRTSGANMVATRDVAGLTSVLLRPELMAQTHYAPMANRPWEGMREAHFTDDGRQRAYSEAMALKNKLKAGIVEQKANSRQPGG